MDEAQVLLAEGVCRLYGAVCMTEAPIPQVAAKAPILRFSEGMLLLSAQPPALPAGVWRWDSRQNAHSCFAMHYGSVLPAIRERYPGCSVQAPQWESVKWPRPALPPLRPLQSEAITKWMATRRAVIVLPTGTGKTEVALHIMQELSVTTLIVSPVRDLMYQWHQRILDRLGYDAGIIGDNTFDRRPVSVTTYDSARIHMRDLGDRFQFIIFDECHHLPGEIQSDSARMCMAPYRLGLTATPERSDGKQADLDALIGPVAYRRTITEESGRNLAEYDAVHIKVRLLSDERADYDECSQVIRRYITDRRRTNPHYTGVNLRYDRAADPEARRALNAENKKKSIEDRAREKLKVLEGIFRRHDRTPVLIFTNTNAMARDVSMRFLIPCILNHSRKKERREAIAGLTEGRYPAIVANRCLDEGVDLPAAKVAVVLGGGASVRQAVQRLGRIIRKKGDQKATLYEVVCEDTKEIFRSRARRKTDAYARTRHQRHRR